jgi:tetratricopeptide (TPR) repeat protein
MLKGLRFFLFLVCVGYSFGIAQSTETQVRAAIEFESRKMYKSAEREYSSAIRADAFTDTLFLRRGYVRLKLGKYEEAIDDFNNFLKISPMDPLGFIGIAKAKYFLNDFRGSIKDLDQAIRFDPENAKYYLERANVKLKMDNLDGAIADYGLTISFSKQNIDAHFLRAHAYVLRMDYPLAIQDYSAVINYDQNNSEALYNRAVLLFEMGLTEAACEDWRVCVQLGKPEAIKWVQQYCKK